MTPKLAFEIYYILLFHIISIIILLSVNYAIYLKAKKTPLLYTYLAVQSFIFIWMLAKILKTVSPNESIRWFFIVFQYLGNCFLGSTFLMFAFIYATGNPMRFRYALSLNLISLVFFLSMVTNPYHMLFYSYYDFYRDRFGPIFYIHQIYSWGCLFTGLFLCARNFRHQFGEKRMQSRLIALGIIVPLLVNIFYIFKLFKRFFGFRPLFDFTPIACNISLIMFSLAIFRYRFFDVVPVGRKTALEQTGEGIILFNRNGWMIERNQALTDFFPNLGSTHLFHLDLFLEKYYPISANASEVCVTSTDKMTTVKEPTRFTFQSSPQTYYKMTLQPLTRKNRIIGTALQILDTTAINRFMAELSEKNRQLQEANEKLEERAKLIRELTISKVRNYIAREVHDVLGHSVVLAISLLEVASLQLQHQPSQSTGRISQTIQILKNSLKELEHSIIHNTILPAENDGLLKLLHQMTAEFEQTGREIELTIQGKVAKFPSDHLEPVYRLCQEAITNSIRHGKATRINIIFRFSSYEYTIYILDNGVGCEEIKQGYGLRGMEQRISQIGGTLKYGASFQSGFSIQAVIPME